MIHALTMAFRPFGAAFGVFILLNLALALQRPELAATYIWLEADIPEPWLSLFASVLGCALVIPNDLGKVPWVRWMTGGVFAGFAILVLWTTVDFYDDIEDGRILTDLALPLSAPLTAVLASEFVRVTWWAPSRSRLPPAARVFFSVVAVSLAFVVITLVYIVTFGHRDFREGADAIVVFGAKVYPDGTPCGALTDRLDTALELWREGRAPAIVLTGAVDPNGQSEPVAMRKYLVARGVPRDAILLDEEGRNTRASAVGCRAIAKERGFRKVLAVSQFFHCARIKMVFEREGLRSRTVPTCSRAGAEGGGLSREAFFVLREAVAFPFYLLYYR